MMGGAGDAGTSRRVVLVRPSSSREGVEEALEPKRRARGLEGRRLRLGEVDDIFYLFWRGREGGGFQLGGRYVRRRLLSRRGGNVVGAGT